MGDWTTQGTDQRAAGRHKIKHSTGRRSASTMENFFGKKREIGGSDDDKEYHEQKRATRPGSAERRIRDGVRCPELEVKS